MLKFFASCPKGLESLLLAEITALKASEPHETVAGVSFRGNFELALRLCLKSRFASRVLLILNTFRCEDDTDLYLGASGIAWENYFEASKTIAVEFQGTNEQLRNTQYSAVKVKDGICDRFLKTAGFRPDVDRKEAQVRIFGLITKGREAILALDLSGRPLFRREAGRVVGAAPLKENLAAAMLTRAGFHNGNLLDPMCGSGTLLIEAASMATRKAPGLSHEGFGFWHLKIFDENLFASLREEALAEAAAGLEAFKASGFKIIGFDADPKVIESAQRNIEDAGFADIIKVEARTIEELNNPFERGAVYIVTNPPYGERLGNFNELISLYSKLGSKVKEHFPESVLGVISSSTELLSCLRLSYDKAYKLYNGSLACQLRVFKIGRDGTLKTEIAPDFANRLRKNLKSIGKWAQEMGLNAYRIYDADIPEYNAAIDLYGPYCVIQEYQAPSTIEAHVARSRLLDLIAATVEVTGIAGRNIILKQRERQKGKAQYEKTSEDASQHRTLTVSEGPAQFIVNVDDYLDTGLFLDSRPIRKLIFDKAQGRSFLNLFAYTGSASVAAALGGAVRTLSVDMSRTYLGWAMDNFALNKISGAHDFVQADCLAFLSQDGSEKFDLIYIDPPTFSNSKRMERSFEVKRDHVQLLANLIRHLNPGGEIIFCTNKRGFKLNAEDLKDYGLTSEDITSATIPFDFKRSGDIHRCFILHYDESLKVKEAEPLSTETAAPKWSGRLSKGQRGFTFKESLGSKKNPWKKSPGAPESSESEAQLSLLSESARGGAGRPKAERSAVRRGNEQSASYVRRARERQEGTGTRGRLEKPERKAPAKVRVWGADGLKEY